MNGIGTLILLGVLMYFMFSRKGGMGCCGGHSDHGHQNRKPQTPRLDDTERKTEDLDVIQLRPDEYEVLSDEAGKHR